MNPTMPETQDLVKAVRRTVRRTPRARMSAALRAVLRTFGDVVPMGDGDAKTDSPGTYRPVGKTCPDTCPFLGAGCYAEGGNVALHQRRATGAGWAAARTALGAIAWAEATARLARLHVSGDFHEDGEISWSYVDALASLCDEYARQTKRAPDAGPLAWTYTHEEDPTTVEELRRRLPWVAIRHSDHEGHNGAIVLPFDRVKGLRDAGHRPLKCPAQRVEGVTCATCKACWAKPDRLVIFDPHGGQAAKVRRAVTA